MFLIHRDLDQGQHNNCDISAYHHGVYYNNSILYYGVR